MAVRALTCWPKRQLLRPPKSALVQSVAGRYWEPDRRGGYDTEIQIPLKKRLRMTAKSLGPEMNKYKEEVKTKFRMESVIFREDGDYEIPWKFNNKELNEWVVTADSDHNEGKSTAKFELGKNNTGIFHGYLDTTVPKDGKIKMSGYANIKSPKNMKSFHRHISYDWTHYNTLMVRLRGDGRPYFIVIAMNRYFDLQWFDQYCYPLYTRGGPYWQEEFIPLNKFVLVAKGRVQNRQENLLSQLDQISHVGVSLMDGHTGPFHLELDYIGLCYDEGLNERDVYELYETEPYKAID